ncbi:RNA polymerase-binding transcription factor DksA [Pseudomonas sp. JAI115]|uniref:hypothetical protein n=1 Tax=Pseudomonas sp. JAI115 TaxID=2723061 RepID=UPI00160D2ED6|nr:hypothetical protein [Pseudomonas sp. JAI115]MBB6155232.1 RNA polymerase-binding transcription factor DksA [Pseudomonas sp. JAI115]
MLTTLPNLLNSKNQLKALLETALKAEGEIDRSAASDAVYDWIDQLHQQLTSDHLAFSRLQLENEELEVELADTRDWEVEEKNYTLHRLKTGSYVYCRVTPTHNAISDYYLCATCFMNKVKSILQPVHKAFECHVCNSSIQGLPLPKPTIEML